MGLLREHWSICLAVEFKHQNSSAEYLTLPFKKQYSADIHLAEHHLADRLWTSQVLGFVFSVACRYYIILQFMASQSQSWKTNENPNFETEKVHWHGWVLFIAAVKKKNLVLHFPHLSAWSMVKSINVLSCFIKILSTSNNSWGQSHWNSGQTEKVNFLYSIILSAHSLCCFHWLSFFKIS